MIKCSVFHAKHHCSGMKHNFDALPVKMELSIMKKLENVQNALLILLFNMVGNVYPAMKDSIMMLKKISVSLVPSTATMLHQTTPVSQM